MVEMFVEVGDGRENCLGRFRMSKPHAQWAEKESPESPKFDEQRRDNSSKREDSHDRANGRQPVLGFAGFCNSPLDPIVPSALPVLGGAMVMAQVSLE